MASRFSFRIAQITLFLLLGVWIALPGAPELHFHLTGRPWRPLGTKPERYLDVIEGLCRFSIRHQNSEGAIIDPFLHHEHQYATPYFAYAVGTLVQAGRGADLLQHGVRAMEHATRNFAGGASAIPDQHGEFFIPCLTAALKLYEPHVSKETMAVWRERMKKPVEEVIRGSLGNWQTYAMKGQWLRSQAGLASRSEALTLIERDWHEYQEKRIAAPPWFLYHDRSSDPDTLSVEAVGRGNLLALAELGYDGPSAAAIRRVVETATRNALWLQDPSGQVPANGRTDDHVWVDVGYQLAFAVMAERAQRAGETALAGQFRHASLLAFQSIERWRRSDPPWDGSYFITKNHFDPALRVGYQTASEYSNYSGSLMFHLAEAYRSTRSEIVEQPAPSEIGGYAFELDPEFATAFANAGGMQMQVNLRGDPGESSGNYWTPVGVVRFARAGWDTRLGPSDGALTKSGGVSFAPAFMDQGHWVPISGVSRSYEVRFSSTFVHPALVRCSLSYTPTAGALVPAFRNDFTVTPDGILSEVQKISKNDVRWGVTWPVLENDGRPLTVTHTAEMASTGYSAQGDRENFIAIGGATLDLSASTMRSTYGDLRPVTVRTAAPVNRTFIYPANPGQPSAEAVRSSFQIEQQGFRSVVGHVSGDVYVGQAIAGGVGSSVDLDGDGKPDVIFSQRCSFLIQVRNGEVIAVEADRDVIATIRGRAIELRAFRPVTVL